MRDKPVVVLLGTDSHALSITGACRRAARKAGWSDEKWKKVQNEMLGGDYDHVMITAMKYFEVE